MLHMEKFDENFNIEWSKKYTHKKYMILNDLNQIQVIKGLEPRIDLESSMYEISLDKLTVEEIADRYGYKLWSSNLHSIGLNYINQYMAMHPKATVLFYKKGIDKTSYFTNISFVDGNVFKKNCIDKNCLSKDFNWEFYHLLKVDDFRDVDTIISQGGCFAQAISSVLSYYNCEPLTEDEFYELIINQFEQFLNLDLKYERNYIYMPFNKFIIEYPEFTGVCSISQHAFSMIEGKVIVDTSYDMDHYVENNTEITDIITFKECKSRSRYQDPQQFYPLKHRDKTYKRFRNKRMTLPEYQPKNNKKWKYENNRINKPDDINEKNHDEFYHLPDGGHFRLTPEVIKYNAYKIFKKKKLDDGDSLNIQDFNDDYKYNIEFKYGVVQPENKPWIEETLNYGPLELYQLYKKTNSINDPEILKYLKEEFLKNIVIEIDMYTKKPTKFKRTSFGEPWDKLDSTMI